MKKQQKQTNSRRNAAAKRKEPLVPFAVMIRRATLAGGILLLASTTLSGPASAVPISWNSTTGVWDVAANWNPAQLPAGADTVTINVAGNQTVTHQTGATTINSLTNAETLVINNGSTLNITNNSTNTGTIQAGGASAGTLNLNNLTLTNTGGTLTAANGGIINQSNSAITGGTVSTSGTGDFRPTNSNGNFLTNVTVTAGSTINMAQGSQVRERVTGGMTLDGTVNLANGALLGFQGTQTVGGSGSIVFGSNFNGTAILSLDGANTVATFGPNLSIRGSNGIIGDQSFVGGGGHTFINQGLISADAPGNITIRNLGATATNEGVIEARNGGTLALQSDVTNSGTGNLRADGAGSVLSQQSATITGGAINTANGGQFRVSNSSTNFLDGVTLNGNMNMAVGSQVRETTRGGFTLNGTVDLNASALFAFRGNQTIGGNGSFVFGDGTNGTAIIGLDGVTPTVTLGSNIVIRGRTGVIGDQAIAGGGPGALINNGRISADVAGGEIVMRTMTSVTNNGILEAQNGGTLRLRTDVIGNSGSQIIAGAGSTVIQDSSTLSGTINSSGGGSLQPTNSNSNFLDAVTLNGKLNMAVGSQVRESVINGLTLNGTVDLNASALLAFRGTQTIGGTGTFVFGDGTNGTAIIGLDGVTPTVTLGSNIVIRGQTGFIGDQVIAGGGAGALINNGRISADVAGGQIQMRTMTQVTNNGILEAQNGGTLRLQSDVDGGASGQIRAGAGSTVIQDGVTLSGNINVTGGGSFQTTNNSSNFLDAVTFTGNLDMDVGSQVRESVINGLTLNGTVDLNASALLAFRGTQTIGGTGTIAFGDGTNGTAIIGIDGTNSNVTFGPNLTIRGKTGIIGDQVIQGGGGNAITNQGTISADVSGGTISIRNLANGLTNTGVIEARNGGTLQFQSDITQSGAGQMRADGTGSVVLQNSATLTGGTINTTNGGEFRTTNSNSNFISGVTVSSGSVVNLATGSQTRERVLNGLTLDGTINLATSSILTFQGTQTLGGSGEIVFGNAAGGVGSLGVDGANPTLTIGPDMTLRGHSANIGSQILAGGGGNRLVNQGLISAESAGGTFTINGLANGMSNSGTVQAKNGGTVFFQSSATLTNETGGVVEALAGSTVAFQSGGGTPTNIAGNTITGGIWKSNSLGGGASTIDVQGLNTAIATNNADIYLVGANSVFQARNAAFAVTTLDNSLVTNNGALRIQEGRSFTATANSGNFTNNGLLELASGGATSTFKANTSLANSTTGTIAGYGVVDNRVANGGTIVAQLGTLTVNGGMTGNGTARADGAAATLNLAPATAPSFAANLDLANGGRLNLGTQNFIVTGDYTNSSFGVGNAFNARANVSGSGQIQGQGTQQAITGDVTNGTSATVTLDLGNVRGGSSVTKNFQIANTGAANSAALRGAVQTSVNGGNITDARLSGSGVTAQNFGPVAAGGATGNLAVTFSATSGGSLASQAIRIANNFDNVADQTINFVGNASALAVGNATPNANPVNLGNFHVGSGAPSQSFNVTNTTSGAGAERLGISSVAASGNFAASNVLGGGLINGGATSNGTVTAQVSGGAKGANNGAVTINYLTNGTAIDPTFTSQAANSQTINVTANGYALASAATVGPITFANVLRNSVQERFLTITNQGSVGDLFQEGLNASFGAVTGGDAAKFTVSGGVTNLAAGLSNTTAMKVTLDTSAIGSYTAATSVNFVSNGAISGLGDTSLGSQALGLSASVIQVTVGDLAQGQVTPTSVNFGNRRVGDVVSAQNLSVANLTQTGEGLQASIAMLSGANGISASGAPITVAAGAPANNSFAVAIDTGSAGAKSGTARVSMTSDGSFNGGTTTTLAPQDVAVQGSVFRLAQASVTPDPVVVAAQRIGGSNSAAVTIANTATADGFSEGLRVSGNGSSGAASLSGPASALVAAGGSSTAFSASVDTSTAGAKSGSVGFALASDGTGTSNIVGNVALPNAQITVQGNVYAPASTDLSAASVNFGTVRKGTVLSAQNIAVSNTAAVQGLNDSLVVTSITGPVSPFGASASANLTSGLAPGAGGALSATMNTSTVGVFVDVAQVNFSSRNPEMADLALGTKQVNFGGTVNEIAAAAFSKAAGAGALTGSSLSYSFDLGTIVQGSDFAAATLRLTNAILASLPGDSLVGSLTASGAAEYQLSGLGSIGDIAPEGFHDALVDIDTSTLGEFLGTIVFNGASHNAFQTDLTLAQVSISLRALIVTDVPPPPPPPSDVPEPASGALMALGAGGLWWLRRRRAAAPEA